MVSLERQRAKDQAHNDQQRRANPPVLLLEPDARRRRQGDENTGRGDIQHPLRHDGSHGDQQIAHGQIRADENNESEGDPRHGPSIAPCCAAPRQEPQRPYQHPQSGFSSLHRDLREGIIDAQRPWPDQELEISAQDADRAQDSLSCRHQGQNVVEFRRWIGTRQHAQGGVPHPHVDDEHQGERADGDERVPESRVLLSQYIPAPEPPQKSGEQQGDADFLRQQRKKAKTAREDDRCEHSSIRKASFASPLGTFLRFAGVHPWKRNTHQETQSSEHAHGGHQVGARDDGVHRLGMNRMQGEQQGNGSRRTTRDSEANTEPEKHETGESVEQGVGDSVTKRIQTAQGVI